MIHLIENSTIHGLNHIATATNRYFKALWVLLFLFGVGGIVFNIVFIIQKFMSNPVGISQTVNYENFTWPDLTFCNPSSPYALTGNVPFMDHWKNVTDRSINLMSSFKNKWPQRNFEDFNAKIGVKNLITTSVNPFKLQSDDDLHLITWFTYGKTFMKTYLNKHEVSREKNFLDDLNSLFSTEFVQIQSNIPCQTIRMNKSQVLRNGPISYVNINLNLDFDSYQYYNNKFPYKSLFLFVNHVDHMKTFEEIILEPNYKNMITLSQTHFRRIGIKQPCRKTTFKVELYDALLNSTKPFEGDYRNCLQLAQQIYFVKKCNCYSPFLPIFKNDSGFPRLCFNGSIYSQKDLLVNFNCIFPSGIWYFSTHFENLRQMKIQCREFKDQKCDETSYKVTHDKEPLNEKEIDSSVDQTLDIDSMNKDGRYFKRNKVFVIIRPEAQSVDLFEEELQYTFSQFLSDVGGLMGLWLGLSVIGLFEIVEFMYNYIKHFCRKRTSHGGAENCVMV